MVRTIAIASGKGGTGKTTLVANLGIVMGRLGKKVILVDADLDMANLELVLGMESRPITLQDVINGDADVRDALYDVAKNVKFVPAGVSPSQFRRVDPEKLSNVISRLGTLADIILLDCPAGVGRDTIACFSACRQTLLVITPEPMAATDAYKTKIVAERMGSEVIGVVVNLAKGTGNELKDKEISTHLGVPVLARIPDLPEIRESVINGKPIVKSKPKSKGAIEIERLAMRLVGETKKPIEKPGLFARLFSFLRRK